MKMEFLSVYSAWDLLGFDGLMSCSSVLSISFNIPHTPCSLSSPFKTLTVRQSPSVLLPSLFTVPVSSRCLCSIPGFLFWTTFVLSVFSASAKSVYRNVYWEFCSICSPSSSIWFSFKYDWKFFAFSYPPSVFSSFFCIITHDNHSFYFYPINAMTFSCVCFLLFP